MADINGTDGDDRYTQASKEDGWHNYFGLKGNDHYRIFQGTVIGGPGNDIIERLDSPDSWRAVQAAYWHSPAAVTVDLEAGWAQDGYGTTDTLIGVRDVAGTWHGDSFYGSSADNTFYLGNGKVVVDGRGGTDLVWLPHFDNKATIDQFKIVAAIDGLSATVSWAGAQYNFVATVSNIERLGVGWETTYALADFIRPLDLAVQGLVHGGAQRWNAAGELGTPTEVSFSFVQSAPASGVGATGFQAFTEAQRVSVRAILESAAQATGLTFRELASGGQLSFGASQQTGTKGVSGMPGEALAGQVWMDIESMRDLAPGTEGYAALLHEVGHALGLRHTRNADPGDAYAMQWRIQDDHTSRTVMSQAASVDGLFQSNWGAYDVTALRYLYGTRAVNSGDTSYSLSGLRFTAQSAITDDGGSDTLDASKASTGAAIDLAPGKLSSVGVTGSGLAALDNLAISPDSWIENAIGSDYDDVIKGNSLDNVLRGGKGNDWLEGGAGTDTATFDGVRANYLLSTAFGKMYLSARDGTSGFDTLIGIEKLSFASGTITLGAAGLGADVEIGVDENASTSGMLPAATDTVSSTFTYAVVKAPAHGTLTLGANGAYTYTPAAGYFSDDVFSYSLTSASGIGNTYYGYVSVRPVSARLTGTAAGDLLTGGTASDTIDAGAGSDKIIGSAGSDVIGGGSGMDWVVYSQNRASYELKIGSDGKTSVDKSSSGDIDVLSGVERIAFAGGAAVALDLDGAAGQTYRVYQAAFDRKPDAGGLGYWLFNMDRGVTIEAVAAAFMQSQEFIDLYGAAPTADQFVSRLYYNVLHRAPEQAGYDYWVNAVEAGFSRAAVLALFAESAENQAQVIGAISLGIDYLPFG